MFIPALSARFFPFWKFVCMLFDSFFLSEREINLATKFGTLMWTFVFILKWSRGRMSPGAGSCNAASARPGQRCITCNAVYHDGPVDQCHDCLSPCTQKYRLQIRVKLIFSISEEAGDLVTLRDRDSWPPRDLRQCLTSARMVSYESAKVTFQSGIGLPSKAEHQQSHYSVLWIINHLQWENKSGMIKAKTLFRNLAGTEAGNLFCQL